MSQSLNKVKKRIATVQATQKLTGAMKLVSSVKYSKLSKEILHRQDYYFYLNDLASTYFSAAKINNLDIPYIRKNLNTKKRLLVVVSSSMGMCGAYNINIKKMLENEYKNGDEILVIGKKLNDEINGENLSSEKFAKKIKDISVQGFSVITFYIGGSNGLDEEFSNSRVAGKGKDDREIPGEGL